MSDEELTKAIYEAMQVPYLSERHDAIKNLIKQHREAYALGENKNGFFGACGVCGVENIEKAEEYYRMYRAELRKLARDDTK